MDKSDIRIYNADLGLDGTIEELINWSYRYSDDYTDAALDEIARQAETLGLPKEKYLIPTLVKLDRKRTADEDETLPYEQIKLDKLYYGKISFGETMEYGEVEIREEGDKVLIAITGTDDEGDLTAATAFSIEEFMSGDENWLEQTIGSILFYGKTYDS